MVAHGGRALVIGWEMRVGKGVILTVWEHKVVLDKDVHHFNVPFSYLDAVDMGIC